MTDNGRKRGRLIGIAVAAALAIARAGLAEVDAGQIRYVSGTLAVAPDTVGRFDTTPTDALVFHAGAAADTRIAYTEISKVEAYRVVARHLGVLPAVGAALVRKRERKHFVSITYKDAAGKVQVALFEVPKTDPPSLLPIFQGRAPQACGTGCEEKAVEEPI